MKRWLSLIILIFFPLIVFAKNQDLIVMLDWFANPDHAPLFVAQQQGFFKKEGLNVQLLGPADPSDPPKLVAAGNVDIAITYQPQLLIQVDQGLPLVRIATLIDSPLNCLVVNGDSNIKTLSDLKNKKIGYSTPGIDDTMIKTMLQSGNLSLNDVTLINVRYDLTQALLANRVDAVTGMMRNFELIEMKLLGKPGRAFFPENYGVPTYDELVLIINKKEVNDPRIKKFLAALQEGVIFLKQHPKLAWEQFVKVHPELDNPLNKQAWFATLPFFANNPGVLPVKKYNEFAAYMQKMHLIKTVPKLNQYTVQL